MSSAILIYSQQKFVVYERNSAIVSVRLMFKSQVLLAESSFVWRIPYIRKM